ncbi:hypothetical protein [Xanthomonas phage X1]|nr:hypothetical protein [Xanthomonas phage X1]
MKLFKTAIAKLNAIPRKNIERVAAVVVFTAVTGGLAHSFINDGGMEFFKPKTVAVAQADTYAKPIVEEGFFLTKTTWPDYKDTVSAEQYANQTQFDRTHLGPCSKDKPCEKPKSYLDYNLPDYLTK